MKQAQRVLSLSSSQTLALNAIAEKLRKEGKKVIAFTAGEPDFPTPDYAKNEAIKAVKENFTRYTPVNGIDELIQAIAEYESKRLNIPLSVENVLVTPGAKFAIYAALAILVENNDEVVFPSPYWVSYPEMVKLVGGIPKPVKTTLENRFQLSLNDTEKIISNKTKMIILNSPNNPTGVLYTDSTLVWIAELMRKNKDIVLVSDDIYESIVFGDKRSINLLHIAPDLFDRVLVVNGVSKKFSMTGWRIGWLVGPSELIRACSKFLSHTISCSSSISQMAALGALKYCESESETMRKTYERRMKLITSLLSKIPKIRFVEPDGAFYVFLDVSEYLEDRFNSCGELVSYLLEKYGVLVVPGDSFGDNNFIRLSFATSDENIVEGCENLGKAFKDMLS